MKALRPFLAIAAGAILPTYDAVFLYNEQQVREGEPQIPLIVPANEQGAGFMAAGYARATGRVGVCIVTSGPGATNTVTPGARFDGGFGANGRDLWSSGARIDWNGCFPGSPGSLDHGLRRETHLSRDRPDPSRSYDADGI